MDSYVGQEAKRHVSQSTVEERRRKVSRSSSSLEDECRYSVGRLGGGGGVTK